METKTRWSLGWSERPGKRAVTAGSKVKFAGRRRGRMAGEEAAGEDGGYDKTAD